MNKVPLVAATSLDENGGPLYVKLQRLEGFSSASIQGTGLGWRCHQFPRCERRASVLWRDDGGGT